LGRKQGMGGFATGCATTNLIATDFRSMHARSTATLTFLSFRRAAPLRQFVMVIALHLEIPCTEKH